MLGEDVRENCRTLTLKRVRRSLEEEGPQEEGTASSKDRSWDGAGRVTLRAQTFTVEFTGPYRVSVQKCQ